jgi:hypothetical protein
VAQIEILPLAEVSSQIRQRLDAEKFDNRIDARIKDAGVKIDESFFQK